MLTPKASFFPREGQLLGILLWFALALFIAVMVVTWIACERAHPVLLDLSTGKPAQHSPL